LADEISSLETEEKLDKELAALKLKMNPAKSSAQVKESTTQATAKEKA